VEIEKLKTEREEMIKQLTDLFKEKDELNRRFMELKEDHLKTTSLIAEKDAYLKAAQLEVQKMEAKMVEAQESVRLARVEQEIK
jgi:hypothetical protein